MVFVLYIKLNRPSVSRPTESGGNGCRVQMGSSSLIIVYMMSWRRHFINSVVKSVEARSSVRDWIPLIQ